MQNKLILLSNFMTQKDKKIIISIFFTPDERLNELPRLHDSTVAAPRLKPRPRELTVTSSLTH